MNKFELFCMIFYVLDAEWDETKDPDLGKYLSGANPFLFSDISSADPNIYANYAKAINEPISISDSFRIASKYVAGLDCSAAKTAFSSIEEAEWLEWVKDFLSQEHKGKD